jgi:hypothetical protein
MVRIPALDDDNYGEAQCILLPSSESHERLPQDIINEAVQELAWD